MENQDSLRNPERICLQYTQDSDNKFSTQKGSEGIQMKEEHGKSENMEKYNRVFEIILDGWSKNYNTVSCSLVYVEKYVTQLRYKWG